MEPSRIIQTTLVSGEFAASFVFVAKEQTQSRSVHQLAEQLGIKLRFGHDGGDDSYAERTLEMAVIAISSAYRFPFLSDGIGLDAREEDLKSTWAAEILRTEAIVIAKSPPIQTDFLSLVKGGSGAAIGAYVGWAAGQATPPLLLITVPAGLIICAAAMALAQALEQGLGPKILQLFRTQ